MHRYEVPLGIVLAGGEGKRLMPLTADRAKPAVPFGGSYRLIDFVLSNLVNAEMRKIVNNPEVKTAWAKQGAVPLSMTVAEFEHYLNADIAKWANIVKVSGAAPADAAATVKSPAVQAAPANKAQ